MAPTSPTDVLLIDLLKVNDSDPTPTPNQKPTPPHQQARDRVGF